MKEKEEFLTVRRMTPLDLPRCHEITQAVKWAHRLQDWEQAYRVSQGVVVEHVGRVVGSAIACVKAAQSSIGLIAIDPAYQRRGLGRRLTQEALRLATANVTLVATAEGRGLYESLGFTQNAEVQQNVFDPAAQALPAARIEGIEVRRADASDLPAIYRIHQSATTAFSRAVLDELILTSDVVLRAHRAGHAHAVAGFCVVRPFGSSTVVGPIVADSVELATALVRTAMHLVPARPLRVDSNDAPDFVAELDLLGFRSVSRVARMSIGQPPRTDSMIRQFSLASQALL